MNIDEEIIKLRDISFSKTETIKCLIDKGFSPLEIENHINIYYKKAVPVNKKSFSFLLTFIFLTLFSLIPLIDCFLGKEYQYFLLTAFLLIITIGFYKLLKIAILTWLTIIGLLLSYLIVMLFYKLTGGYTNSLYSFGNMTAVILFLSVMFRIIYEIYQKNKKYLNETKD